MEIQEHVPLASLTTFGIGGPARFFARIATMSDLYEALAFAKDQDIKTFILGGGSNLLIDDAGFSGLVIKIELSGVELAREADTALIVAAAGEIWDKLVERAVQERLWGLENLSGIPGTVGGAVVQNIGAYGAALSQRLEWVEALDREEGKIRTLTKEACRFGYRDSIFKQSPGRYVILHAAFALSAAPSPDVSYKDLASRFKGVAPSLEEIRDAVIEIRKNKFPDPAAEGTAGSFFKNPIVSADEAKKFAERYPGMPIFAMPESAEIKIPLGWLLDYRHHVLDMRDVTVGGARLYEKQYLVIAAERGTTAQSVKELAKIVQEKVLDACNLAIEPEVCIVER